MGPKVRAQAVIREIEMDHELPPPGGNSRESKTDGHRAIILSARNCVQYGTLTIKAILFFLETYSFIPSANYSCYLFLSPRDLQKCSERERPNLPL